MNYLHVLPIFSNFVIMPKDQMTGGILFLSCLSVVNINIRCNCLTICDRDFIWHAYSTSRPFLMTLTFTLKKKTFLGRCCRQGNSVSVCVRNLPFPPKYHILHHLGSAASPISLIRLWTTTVLILMHIQIDNISCNICTEFVYLTLKYKIVNIYS